MDEMIKRGYIIDIAAPNKPPFEVEVKGFIDDSVLLVSTHVVAIRKFANNSRIDYGKDIKINYRDSDIRNYLTEKFIKGIDKKVQAVLQPHLQTKDNIFLLSKEELEAHFEKSEMIKTKKEIVDGKIEYLPYEYYLRSMHLGQVSIVNTRGIVNQSNPTKKLGLVPAVMIKLEDLEKILKCKC